MSLICLEYTFNGGMLKVTNVTPGDNRDIAIIEQYRQHLNGKNVLGNIVVTIPELLEKFCI
jgi:hypothetical protein